MPVIQNITPTRGRPGDKILIEGLNFKSGSGDAVRNADFFIGNVKHDVRFINENTVEITIQDWTHTGFLTVVLDNAITTRNVQVVKIQQVPPV